MAIRATIGKYARSLWIRLFLILLFVGIVPIYVLKSGILRNYEQQAIRQRIELIRTRSEVIAAQIGENRILAGEESESLTAQIDQMASMCTAGIGMVVLVN